MTAKITFRDPPTPVEVPVGVTLLEAALAAGAAIGTHCGGVGACAFCHVRVERGAQHLTPAGELEEDGLDRVFDVRQNSRLACQARIASSGEINVRITDESFASWLAENPGSKRR